jgi:uncharacterized protein YgbK (DUF1537 family)
VANVPSLHLAFFGDDFTGSTDALESLTRAGLRTVLFMAPPSAGLLASFPRLDAVGVAGLTRALAPDAMEAELRPAFRALQALRPRHVHYKVCSTFDSSPDVGSIGRAIEVGADVFRAPFVPLVVGAPALGRFCIFGNLFARFGIGSAGAIHRLDRHPSISRHPVTPMTEADLQVHLSKQTTRRIGLLDVLALERSETETRAALEALLAARAEIVLFDVLVPEHLERIGALLEPLGTHDRPLFCVGSSAVGAALTWRQAQARPQVSFAPAGPASPLLVVSGSCSPVTAGQIDHALEHGFAGIGLAPDASNERETTAGVIAALRSGRHTVVYTSRRPEDQTAKSAPASMLGAALGRIALAAAEHVGPRRVLFAGGDSSSYAARALGIEAVEMIAPLAPGAPLCRVHAPGTPVHGLEVNFKGGQVGAPDYFSAVARGTL